MATLTDAVDALNRRKEAAYGGTRTIVADRQTVGLMFLGLDLDHDEVSTIRTVVVETMLREMIAGNADLIMAISAPWVDGLMTGLILADLRAREEAHAAS